MAKHRPRTQAQAWSWDRPGGGFGAWHSRAWGDGEAQGAVSSERPEGDYRGQHLPLPQGVSPAVSRRVGRNLRCPAACGFAGFTSSPSHLNLC